MPFDCFSPFGVWGFTSEESPCEKIYDSLTDTLGPALQGPQQEAMTYGMAMCLGVSQLQLEASAAQKDPLRCTFLLPERERDYRIVPEYGQSENDRQIVLAATTALESGALKANIEAGLTAILGDYFVGWRDLNIDDEVQISVGDNTDVTWNVQDPEVLDAALDGSVRGVAWGQNFNRWVAVGHGSTYPLALSDNDGQTWTRFPATSWPTASLPAKTFSSVCYGSTAAFTGWVAVCETTGVDTNSVYTSDNGEVWTARVAEVALFKSVTYDPGCARFIAVGSAGHAMESPNGTAWSAKTIAGTARDWKAVAAGNGLAVAVSTDGYSTVAPSFSDFADGVLLGGGAAFQDIAFGNGVFVAVASTGANRIYWTADGVTWTAATGAPALDYYVVTFCDGLFVAFCTIGSAYTVATSTDGKTWTSANCPVYNKFWRALGSKPNKIIGVSDTADAMRVEVLPQPKLVPDYTPIIHVRLGSVIMPGSQTVAYTYILGSGTTIKTGDWLTVDPGRLGQQERVQVTAATGTTFTATFRRPHESGVRATTAQWPSWRSTKRHSLVLVNEVVLTDRTLLAKVNLFMRKVMPTSSTWTICLGLGSGYTTPLNVGGVYGSTVGYSPIGSIRETHL